MSGEKYQPTPGEVQVGEDSMTEYERRLSEGRENSHVDMELVKKCVLSLDEGKDSGTRRIQGTVDGVEIKLSFTNGINSYHGEINGVSLESDDAMDLWKKFLPVALLLKDDESLNTEQQGVKRVVARLLEL